MKKIAIIILAAGASSRLGRPKQLLPFREQLLIERVVAAALGANAAKVLVVTGATHEHITKVLSQTPALLVHNPGWEAGMASSIAVGMEALSRLDDIEGAILSVCDQPFVSSALFLGLAEAAGTTGEGIIACRYADTIGVPVLFHSRYFYTLASLGAGEGAKSLLSRFGEDVAVIPFPEGVRDIDTEEDYARLLQEE